MQLQASTTRLPADNSRKDVVQALANKLPLHDSIDLLIYTSEEQVHFIINGKEHMAQDIAFRGQGNPPDVFQRRLQLQV
jgi:hypothetical protein